MVFVGDGVRLRPMRKADLPALVAWTNDAEVDRYMDGGFPKTLEAAEAWLLQTSKDRQVRRYSIETLAGVLIGDLSLGQIAWRSGDAELTVRIGERDYWGRGLGTDAVSTLLDLAFGHLGLRRVYLRVYRFNARAVRTYEKCGFRREGVLRRGPKGCESWKEIVLMCKLKEEHVARVEAADAS